MTGQRLAVRRKRRNSELAELRAENVRLKQIIALADRKAAHGCTDFSCQLCDAQYPKDSP